MPDPSDICPTCQRKMQRRTTAFKSVYFCAKCEKNADVQAAKTGIKGDPKPPK